MNRFVKPPQPPTAERANALLQLHTSAADHRTPCVDRPDLWLSQHASALDEAVLLCLTQCPVLDQCERYVQDWPEHAGVWAGRNQDRGSC